MKPNDQFFEPGDKVVQALTTEELLKLCPDVNIKLNSPDYGSSHEVYCIVECFPTATDYNAVRLVGFGNISFPAAYFRKVDEIARCVRVAEMLKTPTDPITIHE